jgi:signal transduction histidine kinase
MIKKYLKLKVWGAEGAVLFGLSVLFFGTLGAAWLSAMSLRSTFGESAAKFESDPGGLTALEKLRNLANSKITNRRIFFLSGSPTSFEKQQKEDKEFAESLTVYQKKFALPGVDQILQTVSEIGQREQEFFQQGMEFRDKAEQAKIIGQFYSSKTSPLLAQLNQKFDELATLHTANLEAIHQRIQKAESEAQGSIPGKMRNLTIALVALFAAISLLIMRILGQRQRLLTERDRLAIEAKNAILSRDEVLAAVSRDLKDPIAQLMSDEVAGEAENVKAIATDLQCAVADIVDHKKADLGDLALRLEQYNINEILDRAQVAVHSFARTRDVNVQFDGGTHSVLAYVDVERVHRVLVNLIGNAIKFSPKHSKVLVKVKSDPQFAHISVIDSGSGIPSDRINGIFDNFWQARKTSGQGAGVGLAVVKSIVEAHGGTVRAENSKVDSGTVITFTLPRRRPANAPIKKPMSVGVRTVSRAQATLDN